LKPKATSKEKQCRAPIAIFSRDCVWHITHRCHQKEFLLKFARDRHCYLRWLFEAKKRFGVSVLNYM
jgi:hypothetical protein